MKKKQRKYIYLNNKDFDGTVFQTQVLDWLHLYQMHHLEFDLIQAFHVKDLKRPSYIKKQLTDIRKSTKLFTGSIYLFPSKGFLYVINAFIIFFKIFKYFIKYHEVLIFSRALIGKEILFLRKISPVKIIFYFDARAASAEENKYSALKNHDFSIRKYIIIANIYYLEYKTLFVADKVFVVSNVLQKYFINSFAIIDEKFMLYPCLSDSNKFYFDLHIRKQIRQTLRISDQTKVYIYAGGIGSDWHVSERMFMFFNELLMYEKDSLLICLTKDKAGVEKTLGEFPALKPNFMSFFVPNDEVFKYLNLADYGILFRENTIMNNVASPTKYAEYLLCGLPVIISEGVGDYSAFTIQNDTGILLKEIELNYPKQFDFKSFLEKSFDREHIANIGKQSFSKNSLIINLIEEFKA